MSSSSSRRYYSRYQDEDIATRTHCKCKPPHLLKVKVAWTRINPGRRFKGCPIYDKDTKCFVYGFLDDELPSEYYKELLYNLYVENKSLKQSLRNKDNLEDLKFSIMK
ncbi:hypothetical protein Tco_0917991 [Tanacetum coccineum]